MSDLSVGKYPDAKWVKSKLRNNLVSRIDYPILGIYVVGSEARGRAKTDSDLDIAVVVPNIKGKSALQISDRYHSKFSSDQFKPHWGNRVVDFQFFYPDDPELESYSKIPIQESAAKSTVIKPKVRIATAKIKRKSSSTVSGLSGLRK